jgi:crotonobetainyl-CoA:carnitine CoA-transferase CaiB-like acyl-CoA transferase
MMLAYMGAQVTKVEPIQGEEGRQFGPPFVNGESAIFMNCNRNKLGLALNFLSEEGREILNNLIANSDVLVHNFRPDFTEKINLDYENIVSINPNIVYCHITGYGNQSEYRNKPASDSIIQSSSAFMYSSGEENDPPIRCGAAVVDIPTGITASTLIVGALFEREKTGGPKRIDISLFDVSLNIQINRWAEFIAEGQNPPRELNPRIAVPARQFKTKDGVYITISAVNDKFFRKICHVINKPNLADDPKFSKQRIRIANRKELIAIFEEVFASYDSAEIIKVLESVDVPWAKVSDYKEVYSDPLLRQRFQKVVHPKAGEWTFPPIPFNLDGNTTQNRPAPTLGQHTKEVLRSMGYDEKYISELLDKEIIYADND